MNFSPTRVLIVEDDPLMQMGLEQSLSSYSHLTIVGCAEDGLTGVSMALGSLPDVVIMDIGLPRLDGIAATAKIKEMQPEIRVLILTSHTSETEIVASLACGADAYCVKGANIDRLVAAIATAQEGGIYLDPQVAKQVIQQLKPSNSYLEQHPANQAKLSQRELEVLRLMVEGYSNPEIAAQLYLSPNTIKTHVRGIMNKLAVDDRVQVAVVALRTGLV
ncbi:MAG: response regulator transcription factor [Pseudanabaenaceae cyanobacterium bins.68]|nr:response regulator transcription factor [Pseudanabaenaceae cyanobacterium bins.68]